jgi:hypothetical protein
MIPVAPCEISDPCCTDLYDIAAHLLASVYDALMACQPECCDNIAAYVTLGNGDDAITDALTVQFTTVNASPNSIAGSFSLFRAQFTVILRESGWPTARVDGETIVMPQPSEQANAAKYIYARGEAMHRRLSYLQSSKGLVPPGTTCVTGTVGSMTPLNPLGGVAGWIVPVTVDLPWN